MSTIGTRIKEARERKNMTLDQLAKKCREKTSVVARWERDDTPPLKKGWCYLISVLDVNEDWLRCGDGHRDDPDKPRSTNLHGGKNASYDDLSAEHAILLEKYDRLDSSCKKTILSILENLIKTP
ncbi:MAG: helix-turn-helix domain-containing protein, partial [Mariprofundaceae bacterium]